MLNDDPHILTPAKIKKRLQVLKRKEFRVQTISSFPRLYAAAHGLIPRFHNFLTLLVQKCASATALHAPLKGGTKAFMSPEMTEAFNIKTGLVAGKVYNLSVCESDVWAWAICAVRLFRPHPSCTLPVRQQDK